MIDHDHHDHRPRADRNAGHLHAGHHLHQGLTSISRAVPEEGTVKTVPSFFLSGHPLITLDINKQFVYHHRMIQSFASSETEHFFATGKSRRLPPDIQKRAAMRLTQLDGATTLDDLRIPPANRLEALAHDRAGQWRMEHSHK